MNVVRECFPYGTFEIGTSYFLFARTTASEGRRRRTYGCLNFRRAERWGVVSKIVGDEPGAVVKEAVAMAEVIASKGRLAVMAAKESVKACTSLFFDP